MLDARFGLCLLAGVEVMVVRREIPRYATELLNVLAATFGAVVIKLALVAAVKAAVNREVDGQIGDVEFLKCVVDDLLDSLGVLHKAGFTFDIRNAASAGVLAERSLDTELVINADLFRDIDVMGVGQILLVSYALDDAILLTQVLEGGMTEVFRGAGIATEIQIVTFRRFLCVFGDPGYDFERERVDVLILGVGLTEECIAHFGNTQIPDGKGAVLQCVVNVGVTFVESTNSMILIHERSGFGRLFRHMPEALYKGTFNQFQSILECIPETLKVCFVSFTESDAVFDTQLGQDDGDRDIVAATDSGIAETVAVVADQGSTQADEGFPSGYRLRLSLEHCCSPALCHQEFRLMATLLACLRMQRFR